MGGAAITIIGIFVACIGIAVRVFFFVQGTRSQRLKEVEHENERLKNRPRTVTDILDRLRTWREKIDDKR